MRTTFLFRVAAVMFAGVVAGAAQGQMVASGRQPAAPRVAGNQVEACFEEGTVLNPGLMDFLEALASSGSIEPFGGRFNATLQWRNGNRVNTPVTLTYSYVPDGTVMRGTTIQGNVIPETTSTLYSNLDWRFNGNRELWQSKIDSVFQRISGLTGVRFVRIGDDGASHPDSPGVPGVRGDIRIGMRYIDGNGTVLGYAGNDITLDTDEDWGYFGGNYFRLRNVMSHEVGHALGLAHVCPINRTKLMEPTVTGELDGPQHDDVRGLQKIYGDLYEPNDNAAVATPLGDSEPETTVEFFGRPFAEDDLNTTTASLCNTADQDVYQSFVGAPVPVSVTISPKGELYDSSPQSADATCQSGNFINSALYCRLSVAIYGADRVTLLGRADAPGAGYPVSLNNVSIPGGNYYIRVFTTDVNASMEPQSYTMTRVVGSPRPSANDVCAAATPFINGPVYGTTFGAATNGSAWLDVNGISDAGNTRGDVFYSFTATATGRIEAFTANAGNPAGREQAVTIHRACNTSPQNQLAIVNSQHSGLNSIYADVVAGMAYVIRVASAPGRDWGGFMLDLRYVDAPANDRCETAAQVVHGQFVFVGNTGFARREMGLPCSDTQNSPTVWYKYTAPYTNYVHFSGCGGSYDSVMALYDSCAANPDSPIACSDAPGCPDSPLTARITTLVQAGQTIWLRVSGVRGGSGYFQMSITQGPVLNDFCGGAIAVGEGAVEFDNAYATTDSTRESGCGYCCFDTYILRDLWYRYMASETGTLTVDTFGTAFNTRIAAYASCPTGDNQAVSCNEDAEGTAQSRMTFPVIGGREYLIRVGSSEFASGRGVLNIAFTRPSCPADFNDDGFIDFFDYGDYVTCFEGLGCPDGRTADFNGDEFVDFFDYDAFVAAFEAGC